MSPLRRSRAHTCGRRHGGRHRPYATAVPLGAAGMHSVQRARACVRVARSSNLPTYLPAYLPACLPACLAFGTARDFLRPRGASSIQRA